MGITIILTALYVQNNQKNMVSAEGAIITAAPERQYIATSDVNGDGVTTKMTDITRRSRISEQSIIYAASYDYYDYCC